MKKWLVLKATSDILLYSMLMLPMMVSAMFLLFNEYTDESNFVKLSGWIMLFAYYNIGIILFAKLYVRIVELLKVKVEARKISYKRGRLLFSFIVLLFIAIIYGIHPLYNSISDFYLFNSAWLNYLMCLGILVLSYYYLVVSGKASDWMSKMADEKLRQFRPLSE